MGGEDTYLDGWYEGYEMRGGEVRRGGKARRGKYEKRCGEEEVGMVRWVRMERYGM